jgi:hypothetical protein
MADIGHHHGRRELAAGVVRESAKAISTTVASIMATTSPWSMSTTTFTTGSYVTASSSLAVGGRTLRRQAVITGSPYCWRRYELCASYY